MECPELDLPEKDRCSLPEMEYAGKMKQTKRKTEGKGDDTGGAWSPVRV